MIDITDFVVALLTLAALIVTRYLIPMIKAKTTADVQSEIAYWAQVAVSAAEELCRAGKMDKIYKYDYVVGVLQSHGFTLVAEELEAVIDATVWELINQFKKESDDHALSV